MVIHVLGMLCQTVHCQICLVLTSYLQSILQSVQSPNLLTKFFPLCILTAFSVPYLLSSPFFFQLPLLSFNTLCENWSSCFYGLVLWLKKCKDSQEYMSMSWKPLTLTASCQIRHGRRKVTTTSGW